MAKICQSTLCATPWSGGWYQGCSPRFHHVPGNSSELQGREENRCRSWSDTLKGCITIRGDTILQLGRKEKLGIYHNFLLIGEG